MALEGAALKHKLFDVLYSSQSSPTHGMYLQNRAGKQSSYRWLFLLAAGQVSCSQCRIYTHLLTAALVPQLSHHCSAACLLLYEPTSAG